MTIEERIQKQIGELIFANHALAMQGESQAKAIIEKDARIKELEAQITPKGEPNV